MTARELITSAFRLIGVLGSGESMDASMGADALVTLSNMLDGWAAERLTLYSQLRSTKALTASQQRYTIGTGGDLNQARPVWIDRAAYSKASTEYPLELLSPGEWAAVGQKDLTSNTPTSLFYNTEFPLGTIDLWPVPTDSDLTLVLYAPAAGLTSVTDLNTAISLPPGWAQALRYNLAELLAPEYGRPLDPAVVGVASASKARIKRVNEHLEELDMPAMFKPRIGTWNYRTGDFR